MTNKDIKILLTGATGFLGTAVHRRLIEIDKYHCIAAVRRGAANLDPRSQLVIVDDLDADTDWTEALAGVQVVIHAAARVHVTKDFVRDPLAEYRKVNVDGTLNLARQASSAGVKRFIFISSIKVNGESTLPGKSFNEDNQPYPTDPYGISKNEAEVELCQLTEKSGMEYVIIRPPLVYGPGVKGNFQSIMRYVNSGLPLPLGAIKNKRSFVALDNLVDLIITCVDHPGAVNHIFLAGDGVDLSTPELLRRIGDALGKPARLIALPVPLLTLIALVLGKKDVAQRLCSSLQVDISKARERLGWEPPLTLEEGLCRVAQDFKQQSTDQ